MDCAKAAASVALTSDSIRKYHGTGVAMPEKHLPLIAVPTTAGTGSEVTCVSVLSDHAKWKKRRRSYQRDFIRQQLSLILNLTYTMPLQVTAGTGIDVLSHAIEGYWSKGHQPICDVLAMHAAEMVFKYVYRAYRKPDDEEAREKMCEASLIAGLAFYFTENHFVPCVFISIDQYLSHPAWRGVWPDPGLFYKNQCKRRRW